MSKFVLAPGATINFGISKNVTFTQMLIFIDYLASTLTKICKIRQNVKQRTKKYTIAIHNVHKMPTMTRLFFELQAFSFLHLTHLRMKMFSPHQKFIQHNIPGTNL